MNTIAISRDTVEQALLPCPFCGGLPKTTERPDNINGAEFFFAVACYCGGYSATAHKMAVRNTPEQAKRDAVDAWNTRAALAQADQPAVPQPEPFLCKCGLSSEIPHICAAHPKGNPAQRLALHPELQAQAKEPEGDLTIAYMCGFEKGKDFMREAIAKKDAALHACVNLMQYMRGISSFERNDEVDAAITQAQEVLG